MAIPLVPTYDNLQAGSPWLNLYYNSLINDVQAALQNNDGTALVTPLPLTKSGQDLNGGNNWIYGFERLTGTDGTTQHRVAVRDAAAFASGALNASCIQSAINDLPTEGGIVLIPPGVYEASGHIYMWGTSGSARQNVLLLGFGSCSTIKFTGSSQVSGEVMLYMGTYTGVHHAVVGVRFDGNSSYQLSSNSHISAYAESSSALIQSCDFVDLRGDSILATGPNVIIRGCRTSNISGNSVFVLGIAASVDTVSLNSSIIDGGSTTSGVQISSAPSRITSTVIVSHCIIHDPAFSCVYLGNGGTSGTIRDVVVHGNIMVGGGTGGAFPAYYAAVQLYDAYAGCFINRVNISNNLITNRDGGDGIHFINTTVPAQNAEITDVVIFGNVMTNLAMFGVNSGQHIYSLWRQMTRNPTVSCNVIGNCSTYGVYFEGTSTYFDFHTENGCVFGNSIFDDRKDEATMEYGIAFALNNPGGGYTADDNTADHGAAIGNAIYGTTTSGILDQGIANDVAHNTYGAS